MRYIGYIGDTRPHRKKPINRYSLLVDGWVPLPYLKFPCGYLEDNICSIHLVKPLICTSFPYNSPVWKKNDHCNIIRELYKKKINNEEIFIPKAAIKAIMLYPIALTATMYQMNLPIYSLDDSKSNLVQKEIFSSLVDKTKESSINLAKYSQIVNLVSKHFILFEGRDDSLSKMMHDMKSSFLGVTSENELQSSNINLIEKLSFLHYISKSGVKGLINYFMK